MIHFYKQSTQRNWFAGASAAFASMAFGEPMPAARMVDPPNVSVLRAQSRSQFTFSYDGVLGTSLDASIGASSARRARDCERVILSEIERLEAILSVYRPASEIRRVQQGAPVESLELAEVLEKYALWSGRAKGALSSNLAEVISLWKQAEKTGQWPDLTALKAAFSVPSAFNIDALGKGYIIDRAVALARLLAPSGMLNLGGDLRVWGDEPYIVGVADPREPADNVTPRVQISLREGAIATSAGYERYYEIGGQRYSHLIDPRTLHPIGVDVSATIVAGDCLTANALATAAAVLGPAEGAILARSHGTDHLIIGEVDAGSDVVGMDRNRSAFPFRKSASTGATTESSSTASWPAHFNVVVNVALKIPDGAFARHRRPYVAVWVENRDHEIVRTLAIWGLRDRYQPSLTNWWSRTGGDRSIVDSVSRATRAPGAYTLEWNGLDEHGKLVPTGEYKVWVEINREHGHHICESVSLLCGREPVSAEMHETPESDAAAIEYGPKGG